MYWGAWIGSHITGTEAPWDIGAIDEFEQHVGKGVSLVNFSTPFANCYSTPCTPYNFPTGEFNDDPQPRRDPVLQLGDRRAARHGDQPDYQLADVIAGRHDSYITAGRPPRRTGAIRSSCASTGR